MKVQLREVHLQLTIRCNLHCPFCGQWGKHGFMRGEKMPEELDFSDWQRVVASVAREADRTGVRPQFTIWGGEPTLSKNFVPLLRELASYSFEVGVVSNGTLLENVADAVNEYVGVLYFSIDGREATHDRVRGVPGTFSRLIRGLNSLDKTRVKQVGMSVICRENYRELPELPFYLAEKIPGLSQMIFAQMMFLTPRGAEEQRAFSLEYLGEEAAHVDSWIQSEFGSYVEELPEVCRKIAAEKYPFPVRLAPAGLPPENLLAYYRSTQCGAQPGECEMPGCHFNIKADGSEILCVDFDDYVLGNVRSGDAVELFYGPRAEKFRAAVSSHLQPYCRRCSWRTQHPALDL